MRLIDADTLPVKFWFGRFFGVAEIDIVNAPTVDAEPVKHGHWCNTWDTFIKCSECGRFTGGKYNYCPFCGAKMDEVEKR